MENGQIRLQTVVRPYDISELGPFWSLNVHDGVYGHITGLLQSHDGTALISTGNDGNFFYFKVMGQEQLEQKIAENKAKIPSAKVTISNTCNVFSLFNANPPPHHKTFVW